MTLVSPVGSLYHGTPLSRATSIPRLMKTAKSLTLASPEKRRRSDFSKRRLYRRRGNAAEGSGWSGPVFSHWPKTGGESLFLAVRLHVRAARTIAVRRKELLDDVHAWRRGDPRGVAGTSASGH